ncbi:dATP/dGTP pyrophosphohydrolase domain-containing protein [Salmonella enterica]|uniref:dATP/dGTP pyrophosphohydrolase domain-containing protein n=1 Tax=Salmonella enterica TaxID=28901 RepID=UPI0034645E28
MTTITREQQKQILIDTANHVISRDNTSPYSENLRELARIALASLEAEPIGAFHIADQQVGGTSDYIKDGEWPIDNGVIEVYAAPPASEREQIRREHAEWSDKTFGDVGPVGLLKHLSKEALEAAAEPGDLSEWADMQFLLWDGQRRAGISDEQITQAMVEKLAVNKQREWPEPKDGEPRMHIKEAGNSPVNPDGWISCSERMPVIGELNWRTSFPLLVTCEIGVIPAYYGFVSVNGDKHYWFMESLKYGDDRGNHPQGNEYGLISNVTHWMQLPDPPL